MSVIEDTKLHLWGKPFGGEWKYLDSVESWREKTPLLENYRIATGNSWAFRFLNSKETYHGRTYRMNGLNQNEQRLLDTLIRNKTLDITKPFEASQALLAIRIQREEDGKNPGKSMPNKYRLNYIFKKPPLFVCTTASNGNNLWVYAGVVE